MASEESGDELGETPEPPEFEPMRQPRPGRRWKLRLFLLFLVLAVGGAGAGWVYLDDLFPPDDSLDTPLIRADSSPVKVRPISPGGMDVPNRDKTVYGLMEDGERAPSVERLLPPPETPLPPPASAAPAPEPETTGGGTEEVASGMAPASEVAPPPVVPAAPPSPPPEPVVRREAPKKPFKVQLGAVRSPQRASQEWERLRRKHGDLLRRLELSVTKADLGGEKGVFYRMRAGPIADVATARDICAKLAIRKVGCLVVLPGE
jgi:hypothetical protein